MAPETQPHHLQIWGPNGDHWELLFLRVKQSRMHLSENHCIRTMIGRTTRINLKKKEITEDDHVHHLDHQLGGGAGVDLTLAGVVLDQGPDLVQDPVHRLTDVTEIVDLIAGTWGRIVADQQQDFSVVITILEEEAEVDGHLTPDRLLGTETEIIPTGANLGIASVTLHRDQDPDLGPGPDQEVLLQRIADEILLGIADRIRVRIVVINLLA